MSNMNNTTELESSIYRKLQKSKDFTLEEKDLIVKSLKKEYKNMDEMAVSLALDPYSATSIYISILPTIITIKSIPLTDEDKLTLSKKIVYKSIKQAVEDCKNDKTRTSKRVSIGPLYVEKVHNTLTNIKDMDDLIDYLNKSIAKGKKIMLNIEE